MNIIQAITKAFTSTNAQPAPAETTSTAYVPSKEEFEQFRTLFKEKARNKQITAIDILLYNIMRGRDLERGFTPITNERKLAGGEKAYHGQRRLFETKHSLKWYTTLASRGQLITLFESYKLTPDTIANIAKLL